MKGAGFQLNSKPGLREKAQWMMGLSGKAGDLSLNSYIHLTRQTQCCHLWSQLGKWRQVHSRRSERPALKIMRRRAR